MERAKRCGHIRAPVRDEIDFVTKVKKYKQIGFDAMQFYDDAVPNTNELSDDQIIKEAQIIIEQWRRYYNAIRTHSSWGYKTPVPQSYLIETNALG